MGGFERKVLNKVLFLYWLLGGVCSMEKKIRWYNNFWILLGVTLIDIIIPDPIPIIDEIVLILWTSFVGIKTISKPVIK